MAVDKVQTKEFQTEVKQLLDIVIHSLYTEKEIFIRELISNASDALEKYRYHSMSGDEVLKDDKPLQVTISCNLKENTFTISDNGIGMTKEEIVENLGTIAHSGSKAFLSKLKKENKETELIGQFGVGFYSAFMVAENVTVLTKSAYKGKPGVKWFSDGSETYEITSQNDLPRGTKIIVKLRDDMKEYAEVERVKALIKQHSNFISFPIMLNGDRINTIEALWTKGKNEVTDDEYNEFYKFIGNAFDEPLLRLHFNADAPIDIKTILFVPKHNVEKMGFNRQESGISLYCKKILIEKHSKLIVPEWLRFLKGVVDSEDLPLNISREAWQDKSLIKKISKVVTKRFIKFLSETAKSDNEKYNEFFNEFGVYIKEGVTSDFEYKNELSELLRFESSKTEPGKTISLNEYVERMGDGQEKIYFINGANREAIESGPYLDIFKKKDIEVIYTFEVIDDYVLVNLGEYKGKKLVSSDSANLDIEMDENSENALSGTKLDEFCNWFKEETKNDVADVKPSKRLVDNPAIIVTPENGMSSSMQRVFMAMNRDMPSLPSDKILEINPAHDLMIKLSELKKRDSDLAKEMAHQIVDNAKLTAGLMVNTRDMVDRVYKIMQNLSEKSKEE